MVCLSRNIVSEIIYNSRYISLKDLNNLVKEVPSQYKDSIMLDAESVEEYGSDPPSPIIKIYYYRPENDKEYETRITKKQTREKELEARELASLKQLQEKYKGKI